MLTVGAAVRPDCRVAAASCACSRGTSSATRHARMVLTASADHSCGFGRSNRRRWPMATQTQVSQAIRYRGPTILVGALAHLLREEGVEFKRPREDRRSVAEVVEVTLTVRRGDSVLERTLDDMIDTAVTTFRRRFGDDSSSVSVGDSDGSEV